MKGSVRLKNVSLRIMALIGSYLVYVFNCFKWKKPAKPEIVIWVKVKDIEQSIEFTKVVRQRRYYLSGVVSEGNWFNEDYTVYNLHDDLFKAFKKRYLKKKPFIKTRYFRKKKLSNGELTKMEEKYRKRYDKIYKQVKKNGFEIPSSVFDSVDPFKVSIGPEGEFLFMTGKHRLAIAKLMGDDYKMPVKVSHRHRKWQEYRDELYLAYKVGKLSKKDILNKHHPDLLDLVE